MVLSANGYLKRITLRGWRAQKRGGAGIVVMATDDKTGEVVGVAPAKDEASILVAGSLGSTEVILATEVPVMGRSTKGKALAKLKKKETALAVMALSQ